MSWKRSCKSGARAVMSFVVNMIQSQGSSDVFVIMVLQAVNCDKVLMLGYWKLSLGLSGCCVN